MGEPHLLIIFFFLSSLSCSFLLFLLPFFSLFFSFLRFFFSFLLFFSSSFPLFSFFFLYLLFNLYFGDSKMMVHRCNHFPLVLGDVIQQFQSHATKGSDTDEVWLEANGAPLKV